VARKAYLVGEIGSNWLGDLKRAKLLIDEIYEAGADAVKFQVLDPVKVYPPNDPIWQRFPQLQKFCLDFNQLPILVDHCKRVGIAWFASVFNEEDVARLAALQPKFIKVAARDAGHFGILMAAAKTGIPTVVSIAPQHRSLAKGSHDYFKIFGARDRYKLIYCISKYPAQPADVNLSACSSHDGFSDHTLSTYVPVLAAAQGFQTKRWFYVECHVMREWPNRDETPDACCSKTVAEFKQIAAGLRELESML